MDVIIVIEIFVFRAKHRKDARYEETRGDWYFQRKRYQKDDESEYQYPSQFTNKKTKGEDYRENERNKRSKGETERGSKRHKKIYNERNSNDGNR